MKLHSRTLPYQRARVELEGEVWAWAERHGLTEAEVAQALNEIQHVSLKYALRAERHPDDPEKKADEA